MFLLLFSLFFFFLSIDVITIYFLYLLLHRYSFRNVFGEYIEDVPVLMHFILQLFYRMCKFIFASTAFVVASFLLSKDIVICATVHSLTFPSVQELMCGLRTGTAGASSITRSAMARKSCSPSYWLMVLTSIKLRSAAGTCSTLPRATGWRTRRAFSSSTG